MSIVRKSAFGSFAGAFLAIASPAVAQYPAQPITVVIPFEPGSTTDVLGRQIGGFMAQRLGKPVVIDNRSGAGGMVGIRDVARAKPDGYTILYTSSGITAEQSLHKTEFDVTRDFVPITDTISSPLSILVNKNVPVNSLQELIAYAKQNPGKLNYSSSGVGGGSHLATVGFLTAAGIDITHVPYKGGAPALQAVVTNEVQVLLMTPGGSKGAVDGGQLKPLATTGTERFHYLPNVPATPESGVKGYQFITWFGYFAPAGTPATIVNRLQQEIAAALRSPEISKSLTASGYDAGGSSPDVFRQRVLSEVKTMHDTIEKAGIKME